MSRFQFVADHCATYPVKRLCELVEIERSSYYAWAKAAPARQGRARADAELNHKRVARVMRLEGIRGYVKRRKVANHHSRAVGAEVP